MFDDLIRELHSLEAGVSIAISLPADEDGFLDRQCPSELCRAEFKVSQAALDKRVGTKRLFCPLCRHEQSPDDWATTGQLAYAKKVALAKFTRNIQGALESGARRFNQRQRPGFITISLSVTPDRTPVLLPKAVGEAMQQRFTCETCGCRYASIGAAFFCPACGHNSALTMFSHTLETIRKTIVAIPVITKAFGDDRDSARNATRLVVEQSLGKLVGAFEHFSEAVFEMLPATPRDKVKRGSFQRLTEASELWRLAVGKGYEDFLSTKEFGALLLLFQKRHLLTHADGIVDADYLKKSGDREYALGQRIVVRETHVITLLDLIQKLGAELRSFIPQATHDCRSTTLTSVSI